MCRNGRATDRMSWSRKFGWLGFDVSVLSDAAAPDGVARFPCTWRDADV